MGDSFARRDVLRAAGLVALPVLGGCLGSNTSAVPGHVYVENTTGEEREIAVVVAERTDGTLNSEVSAWYRVPARTGLQFQNILDPDTTHVVRAALRNMPSEAGESTVIEPCPSGQDAAARVVTVRVDPNELGIVPYGCKDEYIRPDLEYVDAPEYLVDSLNDPLTTTPGNSTSES